uniref:Putative secreted protein n=1 Tax=Anopheles darlingi TaxID=43151 RepID=A0A2M4DLR2_ANODA
MVRVMMVRLQVIMVVSEMIPFRSIAHGAASGGHALQGSHQLLRIGSTIEPHQTSSCGSSRASHHQHRGKSSTVHSAILGNVRMVR